MIYRYNLIYIYGYMTYINIYICIYIYIFIEIAYIYIYICIYTKVDKWVTGIIHI